MLVPWRRKPKKQSWWVTPGKLPLSAQMRLSLGKSGAQALSQTRLIVRQRAAGLLQVSGCVAHLQSAPW